jgi:hypothetical protein
MRYASLAAILFVTVGCGRSPLAPDPVSEAAPSPANQALHIPAADHGGRPLTTTMTGAEEAPGPGDPDGTGTATITLNHGQGQVCFVLTAANIAPATAAHIHVGPAGVAGPVVVGLTPPATGSSTGCVNADPDLVKAIIQNPADYYVNVHNAPFPGGAIRGQLAK